MALRGGQKCGASSPVLGRRCAQETLTGPPPQVACLRVFGRSVTGASARQFSGVVLAVSARARASVLGCVAGGFC
eukprot:11168999-Lingulodinium_polyedra.AAC.1